MSQPASREVMDVFGAFLERHPYAPRAVADTALDESAAATPAPPGALVAAEPSREDVIARLAALADQVVRQANAGELPRIDLPDIHRTNALFDERGNVFLGHKVRPLALDARDGNAFLRLLLTLEAAAATLGSGTCMTKRGLYYQLRGKLSPDDQRHTDHAITSLANVLRVRRRALGIVEARRGTVHGRLVMRDGTQVVDLSQMRPVSIPRFTEDMEIVSSDAERIVIIEKISIAFRLAEERWCERSRSIMICAEGSPSVSTREFVRHLVETLGLPVLVFTDGDVGGIRVALTFAHGSMMSALETPWLACNGIRWAGLRPSDYDRHCTPSDQIRLNEYDFTEAHDLLEHPSRTYVNDGVRAELQLLFDRGFKVELDSLALRGSRLVGYLDHKIADDDAIEL